MNKINFSQRRSAMVENHIAGHGIESQLVLEAIQAVPREVFLPLHLRELAYQDASLAVAEGQAISQPYVVARMIEELCLKGGEKVLEIGTGTGYSSAVLSHIAADVYTVERVGQRAEKAAAALAAIGCRNVHVRHADGARGWPDHAPYDAIMVSATLPEIPESLRSQLKIGGRLLVSAGGDERNPALMRMTRQSELQYLAEDIAELHYASQMVAECPAAATDESEFDPGLATTKETSHLNNATTSIEIQTHSADSVPTVQ